MAGFKWPLTAYGWRPDSIWGTSPVFMVEGGNYYFYHNDTLGTPQRLTDINGTTVWSATYTAFGEATVDQSSTIINNLRFPGQYYDDETGLHYNWNRYYNPATGRYTQVDPIGFEAGDENLYRYVGNQVTKWADPYGLLFGFDMGESYGEESAMYWADRYNNADGWFESMYTGFMGLSASLWTECTSEYTFDVLTIGWGVGKWAGRPFWRYIGPESNPNSPWLTRGWGWKSPYGRDFVKAKDKLQLPHMPNDVVKVHVPWYKPVRGPGYVYRNPQWGRGGGWEHHRGWSWKGEPWLRF